MFSLAAICWRRSILEANFFNTTDETGQPWLIPASGSPGSIRSGKCRESIWLRIALPVEIERANGSTIRFFLPGRAMMHSGSVACGA